MDRIDGDWQDPNFFAEDYTVAAATGDPLPLLLHTATSLCQHWMVDAHQGDLRRRKERIDGIYVLLCFSIFRIHSDYADACIGPWAWVQRKPLAHVHSRGCSLSLDRRCLLRRLRSESHAVPFSSAT